MHPPGPTSPAPYQPSCSAPIPSVRHQFCTWEARGRPQSCCSVGEPSAAMPVGWAGQHPGEPKELLYQTLSRVTQETERVLATGERPALRAQRASDHPGLTPAPARPPSPTQRAGAASRSPGPRSLKRPKIPSPIRASRDRKGLQAPWSLVGRVPFSGTQSPVPTPRPTSTTMERPSGHPAVAK